MSSLFQEVSNIFSGKDDSPHYINSPICLWLLLHLTVKLICTLIIYWKHVFHISCISEEYVAMYPSTPRLVVTLVDKQHVYQVSLQIW